MAVIDAVQFELAREPGCGRTRLAGPRRNARPRDDRVLAQQKRGQEKNANTTLTAPPSTRTAAPDCLRFYFFISEHFDSAGVVKACSPGIVATTFR